MRPGMQFKIKNCYFRNQNKTLSTFIVVVISYETFGLQLNLIQTMFLDS